MKRKLRKEIEYVLVLITTFQIILTVCINDFELKALPIIIANVGLIIWNIKILEKYGTKFYLEKEKYE